MLLHGPAHCFNLLLRAEDYMTNHPEWFGLRNGKRVPQAFAGAQFCWSNPEARKKFTDNVEAFARQAPQIHILCLVPFDGGQACECDECKKAGASNLLMLLMGEVIERLKTCRPDLLVETVGGYGPMTDPPDTAQIHPQQRVVWAHWGRAIRWATTTRATTARTTWRSGAARRGAASRSASTTPTTSPSRG